MGSKLLSGPFRGEQKEEEMERKEIMNANYKENEIEMVRAIMEEHGAEYTLQQRRTWRDHDWYILQAYVTPEQQKAIRTAVKKLQSRMFNWCRITYYPTVG